MKKYFFTLAFIALIVLAISRLDVDTIIASVTKISLWSFALLLVIQIISQLLINVQWYAIAKHTGIRILFRDILYINAQAEVIHVAPGGHIGGIAYLAMRICKLGDCCGCKSSALVATQRFFSFLPFFTIILISAASVIVDRNIYAYGAALLLQVLLISLFFIPHKIKNVIARLKTSRHNWIEKIKTFANAFADQIIVIKKDRAFCIKLLFLSALIWILYPIKIYFLALQIMPDVNVFHLSAALFASYMFAMLPIFPGGLGGFEATMSGLLVLMGFTLADALALTVVFRFISFWFVLFASVIYIGIYKIITRKV